MSKINLSIYLIKEDIESFADVTEATDVLQEYDENNIAYCSDSYVRQPEWLNQFFHVRDVRLQTSNARVLLLKRLNIDDNTSRIFAVTFGYGKTLLKENVVEEQFGLKIVLNSIEYDKLRKISKTDIGKNYKQSQEQMPKESDIREFSFDTDRDLIRYVTGKSEDENFGKANITGGDIFNLTIDKDINNIDDLLLYCYERYNLETYREHFAWLDNIKLVRDEVVKERLNTEVVNAFNNRDFENVWMAIPEVVKWENFRCVYISGQQDKHAEYNDILNDVFVDSFQSAHIENFNKIKSKEIILKSTEDNGILAKWSAAKCIVGSINLDGHSYSINNGCWYQIDNDFEEEVNTFYDNLPVSNLNFIDCPKDSNEDQYNELLTESIQGAFLIHKCLVPLGAGRGNSIEPCDVAIGKTLIHIKINGGSSYLSHLFNQAANSSEALKSLNFRNRFVEKLVEENIGFEIDQQFKANDYTVVLGIITNYRGLRPRIPFFSKVSIKNAYQNITNMGYNCEIKNIVRLEE